MDLVFEFGGGHGAKTHKGVKHAHKSGAISTAKKAQMLARLKTKGKIGGVQHLDAGKKGTTGRKAAAAQMARPKKAGRKPFKKQGVKPKKKAGKASTKVSRKFG